MSMEQTAQPVGGSKRLLLKKTLRASCAEGFHRAAPSLRQLMFVSEHANLQTRVKRERRKMGMSLFWRATAFFFYQNHVWLNVTPSMRIEPNENFSKRMSTSGDHGSTADTTGDSDGSRLDDAVFADCHDVFGDGVADLSGQLGLGFGRCLEWALAERCNFGRFGVRT